MCIRSCGFPAGHRCPLAPPLTPAAALSTQGRHSLCSSRPWWREVRSRKTSEVCKAASTAVCAVFTPPRRPDGEEPDMRTTMRTQHHSVLRWMFRKGNRLLTCRVDHEGSGSRYRLSLVPHRNLDATAIEVFDTPVSALQRHASIVSELRQLGWTLIAYTGGVSARDRECHPAIA
jgi:hypothetical protein